MIINLFNVKKHLDYNSTDYSYFCINITFYSFISRYNLCSNLAILCSFRKEIFNFFGSQIMKRLYIFVTVFVNGNSLLQESAISIGSDEYFDNLLKQALDVTSV